MSRRDPGAANGGAVVEPVHRVKDDGSRGACSRSGCGCRQYRAVAS